LDKVDTRVDTVIDQLVPVHSVLLLQVGVKAGLNVIDNGFPAGCVSSACSPKRMLNAATHHSSLLTKSPKPGVSTTVNFSLTLFSSISVYVS
jgi:hypothetical protein